MEALLEKTGIEAFLAPLLPPVALALAVWAAVMWASFRASGQGVRRTTAASSVLLSILGAIGFLGFASVDDYNDYPGYTCSLRDGHVPSGFSPERLPPMPDRVSTFHPNIDWSHERELFPAGVRCTYWLRDDPSITVVTHSPWSYSVCVYGLLLIAVAQAVRVVNPKRCHSKGVNDGEVGS